VFFAAGEASGDLQASLLLDAMRRSRPELSAAAIGGPRLRAAGAPLLFDSTELGTIGPLSILPNIPKLYVIMRRLVAAMCKRPSRLFVPVDAGAANLRLIKWLREGGYRGPIVYYFPPGTWLDDLEQAKAVARFAQPLTPFAHQRDFYAAHGLAAAWFGHPLVSVISQRTTQPQASPASIAVLPGSRREEVDRHMEVLVRCAARLSARADISFQCVAATEARATQIQKLWERQGGPAAMRISREGVAAAVERATLAWTASGTAALETALAGVPQIVFYRVSPAQYRFAQRRLPKHLLESVALPNLVLERRVVPELLQADFEPERLARLTLPLLEREELRAEQVAAYEEMRAKLGPPDALARIADFVIDRLEQRIAS